MANKRSFYEWLMKQVDRNDPVGDLARDAKSDNQFPVSATHFGRVLGHLAAMGAGQPAKQALQEAWREYRSA
jgi:uncharacterized protein YozE (UPF0346 family)